MVQKKEEIHWTYEANMIGADCHLRDAGDPEVSTSYVEAIHIACGASTRGEGAIVSSETLLSLRFPPNAFTRLASLIETSCQHAELRGKWRGGGGGGGYC